MLSRSIRAVLAAALLTGTRIAGAQQAQPATVPATTPATAPAQLTATISAVEGLVQVRDQENAAWQRAEVGMTIGEGAEFRTGPRSAVRFEIPHGQTITLDRLGTVKLIEAVRSQGNIKTDLGMRYGRVRYDIEAAGISHDATIHSPSSSLAVRGTQVSLYDQAPFTPEAISLTGRAQFRNLRKQVVAFGGRQRAAVRADDDTSAQTALVESTLQDEELARNDQQMRELRYLFDQQGEVFGNVAISDRAVTDARLPRLFGGRLNFVLRWSDRDYADLNIVVNSPRDETFGNPPFLLSLFPGDPATREFLDRELPQSVPSGGRVGLNHVGREGIEIASWGSRFPRGTYTVAAYNFLYLEDAIDTTGLPKVKFRIEAFLDGQRQPILLNFAEAAAGNEPCRFGLVFEDEIAIGELTGTGLQIGEPYPDNCSPDPALIKQAQKKARSEDLARKTSIAKSAKSTKPDTSRRPKVATHPNARPQPRPTRNK
jgi:hypothetical protein